MAADGLLKITQAKEEDLPYISSLASRIWPHCFKDILLPHQIDNMLEKIYSVEALTEQMNGGENFWLAYLDNEPVAYASAFLGKLAKFSKTTIKPDEKTIVLKKIYILPSMQGKGIGKNLIQCIQEYFADCDNISLYVHKENYPAQDFYKKQGFKIIGEEPVKMGDFDFVDLVMLKS